MTSADATPGCPVRGAFDSLSPDYLADPYAIMAALPLAAEPIFYAPSIGCFVVTRYADIEQVFRDPQTYSAAVALAPLAPRAQQILLAGGHKPQPSMVSLDEPAHGRLRRPAARAFSMKRVNAMIPAIEATTVRSKCQNKLWIWTRAWRIGGHADSWCMSAARFVISADAAREQSGRY